MSTCEAAVPVSIGPARGWAVCGTPAAGEWEYACVHEHVRRAFTCDDHAPVTGQVGCRACWDAGHDCEMAFRRVADR